MSKEKILKAFSYYLLVVIIFYLIPPLIIRDTGSAIITMLVLLPLSILFLSNSYAKLNGFKWYFQVFVALVWMPNIFIMNETAGIYAVIFGVVSCVGQLIGHFQLKTKI